MIPDAATLHQAIAFAFIKDKFRIHVINTLRVEILSFPGLSAPGNIERQIFEQTLVRSM
jgi:hypothetical protein